MSCVVDIFKLLVVMVIVVVMRMLRFLMGFGMVLKGGGRKDCRVGSRFMLVVVVVGIIV